MSEKKLVLLLVAEFIAIVLISLFQPSFSGTIFEIMAAPLIGITSVLKHLASLGSFGNAFAVLFYVGISLVPILFITKCNSRKKMIGLFALSASLFLGLYAMIRIDRFIITEKNMEHCFRVTVSLMIWSVLLYILVVILIERVRKSNTEKLYFWIRLFLVLICVEVTAEMTQNATSWLFWLNNGEEKNGTTILVNTVKVATWIMTELLNIYVFLKAKDFFSAKEHDKAEKLGRLCCLSLEISIACVAFSNFVQVISSWKTGNIDTNLWLPVENIIFILLVFLATRLIIENDKLSEDNNVLSDSNLKLSKENEELTDENNLFI